MKRNKKINAGQWRGEKKAKGRGEERWTSGQEGRGGRKGCGRKKGARSKIKTGGREMCEMLKGKVNEVIQRSGEESKVKRKMRRHEVRKKQRRN